MPGGSTTGAPDWRDAAKLRKFLADDIPQWTPSEGAENTRAFLAALREKCSTEIGAMTGLLLALFEERVDASKAGYELAQKLKRGGGGATPREELDMEMLFGDTKDFESAASVEVKTEQVGRAHELTAMRNQLTELGFQLGGASVLHGDNTASIDAARHPGKHRSALRHLELHAFAIRDLIREEHVRLQWVDTKSNPADLLTKAVPSKALFV